MADPITPIEHALAYAAMGWHVLPVHTIRPGIKGCSCGALSCDRNAGKHPVSRLAPHGLTDATTDPDTIRLWWGTMPDANIGVRTGAESGLVVIDIDIAHVIGHHGDETWAQLIAIHGTPPATVEAITGSGGRHLLFAYPSGVAHIPSRVGALGPCVDSRADGGYIVVAPSQHKSGAEYEWEASSHPFDGVAPTPLPTWILEQLTTSKPTVLPAFDPVALEPDRVRELRAALTVIPSDDRDVWLRVGMALHATNAGQQAFGLWTEWSQTSEKYDAKDQRKTWASFRVDGGISLNTIFALAMEYGWVPVETPALILPDVRAFATTHMHAPALVLSRAADRITEVPPALLSPPGVLGDIARYGVESAVRPVPIFAVQAALALGSIVCGRRYVTSQRNYASAYFLNVAKSGTGKEEAKTTIETILTAANARRLIGGSSYTSGNAVYSALLRKPQHLTIVDEFGKYLEAASSGRDSFRSDALTMMMESFGRVHGDMATPQFSSMTLSAKAAVDMEPKVIRRPAITILAMTTPSSFYDAMRSSKVTDGFLNRFIVAEHSGPRVPMREWVDVPVPDRAVAWIQQVLAPQGNLDLGTQVDHLPDALVVPLTPAALRLSSSFEREMLALADTLDEDGLGDMPIRTREIGLRLSLIAALAESPDAPSITESLLDWCFTYAEFFLRQTVHALRDRVADSTVERTRNTVLSAIRAAGTHGLSDRDLNRGKALVGIAKRDRTETIESLIRAELVTWTDRPIGPRGGRPTRVLVALDPNAQAHDATEPLPVSA